MRGTITSDDFSSMIKKLIYFMDEPAAGPGLLPQYVVSKFAREHVSVVLVAKVATNYLEDMQIFCCLSRTMSESSIVRHKKKVIIL